MDKETLKRANQIQLEIDGINRHLEYLNKSCKITVCNNDISKMSLYDDDGWCSHRTSNKVKELVSAAIEQHRQDELDKIKELEKQLELL